jgi:hypothetical protein
MAKRKSPETLIREADKDERDVMLLIQVDQIYRVVDAMAGLLMAFGYVIREAEAADPELTEEEKMPTPVWAAFVRLDDARKGGE